MILTRVEAKNFLSFESFELALQPGLNVIVGANGAGKSNVLRIASTAFALLREAGSVENFQVRSAGFATSAWERLAPRIGSGHWDGSLSVSVELDDEQMVALTRFMRAVAEIKAFEGIGRQQRTPPAELADLIVQRLAVSVFEPLRNGRLIVSFVRSSAPEFQLAYEFETDEDGRSVPFHVVLAGPAPAGTVRRGRAADPHKEPATFQEVPMVDLDFGSADGSDSIDFGSLLPAQGATAWTLYRSNVGPHPLLDACLENFRPDLLSSQYAWNVPFSAALSAALCPRLTWTDRLRQAPVFDYEPWPGFEQVNADAGATVPLRLYRLLLGTPPQREEFKRISEGFRKLTNLQLAIEASEELRQAPGHQELVPVAADDLQQGVRLVWQWRPGPATGALRCEPRVTFGAGDVRIDLAGAGAWEVLVNLTIATPGEHGVALLDEPATNMFPTLQRQFLAHLASAQGSQIIMVTHSPYLVPTRTDEDLSRVHRIYGGSGAQTEARAFKLSTVIGKAAGRRPRTASPAFSRIATQDDVRAALFARAVIAVEGESEMILLTRFLDDPDLVGEANTLESRGYVVLDVHGHDRFGAYLDVLLGFDIPFVALVDGAALRSTSGLARDLTQRGIGIASSRINESFRRRKSSCEARGVFSLATSYGGQSARAVTCLGCKRAHAHPKAGEIESWLHRHFRAAYHAASSGGSKSQVVREVFETATIRPTSPAVREVVSLYELMRRAIGAGGAASRI
jgi:hypothetical protein